VAALFRSLTCVGSSLITGSLLTASVENRLKGLVGLYLDMRLDRFGFNALIDSFDSAKEEIGCYRRHRHRRPPLDRVYLGR